MSDDTSAQLARAVHALRDLRGRLEAAEAARHEPVAIVGMACRLPGASTPDALWDAVRRGADCVGETPAARWDVSRWYDPDPEAPGKVATRWGGFLDDVAGFDAGFFGISPREAALMDPQQRLVLEVAWDALEDADQRAEQLAGSATGVFMGVHSHSDDYFGLQAVDPSALDLYSGTGTSHSVLSGRLAYLLDLRGPALAVDTACSSSLTAVHLAVRSLRAGECSLAIAGGVNLMLDPTFTVVASRMRMMSPTGRCRPFDRQGDGFVRAEGCAVVVLKRLADARRDGDRVLAVVRGSAANQDGRTNGLTAPSVRSQEAVLRAALADARTTPDEVDLVEAHGTGTPLGDPIEAEALAAVFATPSRRAPLAIGAVKGTIGHAEGAAGVAGLLAAVLALRAGELPPIGHFDTLNPHVAASDALRFAASAAPWPAADRPRVAGVSAFGWSGTNVHVVLEAGDQRPGEVGGVGEAPPAVAGPLLLPVSARSDAALRELAAAHLGALRAAPEPEVAAICARAARGRSAHPHRLAVTGRSGRELAELLGAFLAGDERHGLASGVARGGGTAFVYPGQGGQWQGMLRDLVAHDRHAAEALDRCDTALRPHVGGSIAELLRGGAPLETVDVVQPALFTFQVVLTAALAARGVVPDVVIGHSLGEVAAAHAAGALSLGDAATVVAARSRLLRRIAGQGAMGVVGMSADDVAALIADRRDLLSVAVMNADRSTVIAGDPEALDRTLAELEAGGAFARRVAVDVASHSPQVEPLLGELRAAVAGVAPRAGGVPMISTVTGAPIGGSELTAGYWARNLREPVRFAAAVREAMLGGVVRVVEIGPHPVLHAPVTDLAADAGRPVTVVTVDRRDADEPVALAAALGAVHASGGDVDWASLHPDAHHDAPLPGYPWQHQVAWLPPVRAVRRGVDDDPVLGREVPVSIPGLRVWDRAIDRRVDPQWYDHRADGRPSASAAALGTLLLAAAGRASAGRVEAVELLRFALLDDDEATDVQVVLDERSAPAVASVWTCRDAHWTEHARARLPIGVAGAPAAAIPVGSDGASTETVSGAAWYRSLAAEGIELGPASQVLERIERFPAGVVAVARIPAGVAGAGAALDAALQAARALAGASRVPVAVASIAPGPVPEGPLRCSAVLRDAAGDDAGDAVVDAWVDEARTGARVLSAAGIRLRRLDVAAGDDWLHDVRWVDAPAPDAPTGAPGHWLVVGEGRFSSALADRLGTTGGTTTIVSSPAELTAAVGRVGGPVRAVVVVAPAVDAPEVPTSLDAAASTAARVAGAVAALGELDLAAPVALVTRDVHALAPEDRARHHADAAAWGVGRAVLEEHPALAGPMIDLSPAEDAGEAGAVAAELVAMATGADRAAPADDLEIAWRGARRMVARLVRVAVRPARRPPCRPDATYLVTGGFGSIGVHVARWLIDHGARHLALLGRTELPPRETWAAHGTDGPVGRRIAVVRDLERRGASVQLIAADSGDAASLRAALGRSAAEARPPIVEVHHTAATLGGELVRDLDAAAVLRQLRPKVGGATVLLEQLPDLERLVLYSSIAGTLPLVGQSAYAAANAALDALAVHTAASHRGTTDGGAVRPVVTSVDWGFWEGSDDGLDGEAGQRAADGGVSFKSAARTMAEARGMRGFPADRALEVLGTLLAAGTTRAIVLPVSWAAWADARRPRPAGVATDLVREDVGGDLAGGGADAAGPTLAMRVAAATSPDGARDVVEGEVRTLLGRVLRQDPSTFDAEEPFGAMGLDSLMAVELRNRIEAATGLALSATVAWNYPTIVELAAHLAGRLAGGSGRPDGDADLAGAAPAAAPVRPVALSDEDALRQLLGDGS